MLQNNLHFPPGNLLNVYQAKQSTAYSSSRQVTTALLPILVTAVTDRHEIDASGLGFEPQQILLHPSGEQETQLFSVIRIIHKIHALFFFLDQSLSFTEYHSSACFEVFRHVDVVLRDVV